ncbi:hypothetical protein AYL99_00311 [Fonsecaea erecta]|uniref:Very-long-chain 3-oxoacyl-CoA synthase n=1 Tax=Fonsecaea erecta TaxID=1367422 RepID=A0A178ZWZ3_9EURO|nr:hypothetical protein AYL99_00311 [Fonsecaea erecta]OAP64339.1 hypothetical protein AYL99_00311 [Fonsecaea erecta]
MSAQDTRPLTSLPSLIMTTIPFVFLWSTLKAYVANNGPFTFARPVTRLNNQVYALFSLALALLILNDVVQFQNLQQVRTADLAYTYHLSKFYEYIDVFNLSAAGSPINHHMAFHHITTPLLTHFRVLNASDWQPFAFLNCFHHFWMYGYFGGVSSFRPVMRVTGWVQLAVGIGLDLHYFVTQGADAPEAKSRAISFVLMSRYAMLHYAEIKERNAQKADSAEKKGEKPD